MSVAYRAVNWNRQKRIYDAILAGGVVGGVGLFAAATAATHPDATVETILIRGIGITGFLLLHLILAIGPLARLDRRFLPLLYNRRHLGVTLGLLAAAHAGLVLFQYHALGDVAPLVSLFSLPGLPFEWFGVVALGILFLMAATSHDYWLAVLTPPAWKRLHFLVYPGYVALLFHVGLGVLQDERHPAWLVGLALGAAGLAGLHLAGARRERPLDERAEGGDWVDVGAAAEIPEGRARIGLVGGERVAVFRHRDRLSCVSNVCKHQNGPLGEGRIVDGCITCPWHGYQYRPEDGTSPPPFDDSIPTFDIRVVAGRVLVGARPHPPGTRVEPVPVPADPATPSPATDFYVGYQPAAPAALARFLRGTAVTVLVLGAVTLGGAALAQRTFDRSAFGYGTATTIEGIIRATPFPLLEVRESGADRAARRYLLAGPGKRGARNLVAAAVDRRVRATGALAHRDNLSLLEIATLDQLPGAGPEPGGAPPVDLGVFRLTGEIVDSKCYAGVMNPGRGTTHRGCAIRCLSGGLTPLLVTRDSTGATLELIVVGENLAPVPGLARRAGRPVTFTGRVLRQEDLWYFQVTGS